MNSLYPVSFYEQRVPDTLTVFRKASPFSSLKSQV